MADVRSLLRSELASRRGTSQTSTASTTTSTNRVTKKRKVDPTETLTRKKVRHANAEQLLSSASAKIRPPAAQLIAEEEEEEESYDVETPPQDQDAMRTESDTPAQAEALAEEEEGVQTGQSLQTPSIQAESVPPAPQQTNIDEDEWAAFEREVAAPTRVPVKPAAISAAATISAAPVTTQELAAQQEKEKEDARRNREAEVEGEREDAARFLEEEFDEMEQLEERVRRLKNMREQLRVKRTGSTEDDEGVAAGSGVVPSEPGVSPEQTTAVDGKPEEEGEEEEDDDDDDDDWDNWRFR
ncbi:hypothetical protein BJY04DRAFT_180158 [Aspergillus karnatakaensis]|uniref:uncharacterized protein n=1 Tax=Aspergillus karnatakaensis TaxID=1810916 RepID=UPI003CCDCD74